MTASLTRSSPMRAHLSGRHYLVLRVAGALERAFPGCGSSRSQRSRSATWRNWQPTTRPPGGHRLTVAAALLAAASAGTPAEALGAGGSAAARRIRRLIDPPARGSMTRRAASSAALAGAAALGITALTLAAVTFMHCSSGLYAW